MGISKLNHFNRNYAQRQSIAGLNYDKLSNFRFYVERHKNYLQTNLGTEIFTAPGNRYTGAQCTCASNRLPRTPN